MNEYQTIFQIPRYGPHIFALSIGMAALLPGVPGVVLFFASRRRWPKRVFWPISLIIIGCFALACGLIGFHGKGNLLNRYDAEDWTVIEGTVHVLREQPYGGHAPGDLIEIDGVQVEIDKFRSNMLAYAQTIAHGGHLTEGIRARLFLIDGLIVRVDVAKRRDHNK
ncbi:MAG: hypothetical protein HY343_02830 [Lentisphaerae bacterium]|nr:hypothetical protein [Lentisphaerota bacterium]